MLDIRRKFFSVRVVRKGNRLSREVMESPPHLLVFRKRVYITLRDMVCHAWL